MRAKSLLFLLIAPLCWLVNAQDLSNAAATQNTAVISVFIAHTNVIDTETGHETPDQTVILSGDRISAVQDSKSVKPPPGAEIVDGTGKYLIPGLWDMHVHGTRFDATFPLYLANGVTGVREMFGPPDVNKFRSDLAARKIDAPHLYLGSPIIDGKPVFWPRAIGVSTPEEARSVVADQKQKGAEFIKVYNELSRDSYFAIIDESKHLNIPVVGHVPDAVSDWEASSAKQKSIEHLDGIPLACSSREEELRRKMLASKSERERHSLILEATRSYSEEKCRRLFAEFKKNGTWQVPTLTVLRSLGWLNDPKFRNDSRARYFSGWVADRLAAKDDFRFKDWTDADFTLERERFVYYQRVVAEMFAAHVPMLAGTDSINPYCFPGFSLHDELALLVESGLTPLAALQTATRNPAQFMDATAKYGSVAPGKIADLVLLDADPLKDIHNTTKISGVFLAGKEFDRAALDQLLRNAEVAAKQAPVN
jgi:hypothetical protein